MMDNECEVLPLRVIRVRSNGKRDFDPGDKRRLVEACLRPGVSVSGMALKLGINTNQLRKWIQLHQVANEAAAAGSAESALPAFAPVVEISGVTRVPESAVALERLRTQAPAAPQPSPRLPLQPALLTARLPNGVTVELECGGQDVALVKAMIEALGAR
ncbi:transposase [Cupriavidus taiwanensis]|uniref:IS66-like element accessory protein TnpA n=1 Tax=Cupriavidus taiwanensis TaxID=164546 RepID=UPI00253F8ECA|nr:transposase [Cupriavidus taiwanensis]MDK3022663.1 transposase [Cupriavidus taiwanensis]